MKVKDIHGCGRPVISFEFFPPKTDDGMKNLMDAIASLKELSPSFVTMTYGAGGSTREKTVQLVSTIKNDIGMEAVAHLTCVGHDQAELFAILKDLEAHGIENVLALRGDPPRGQSQFTPNPNGFRYASELVRFIRKSFSFCVGVAGYPEKHIEAPSMEADLKHLKEKVDAGADYITTQLFFSNADYFSFVNLTRGLKINVPVTPGIMPITDFEQIKRFTSMCGAALPASLLRKLDEADGNKDKVAAIGIEHATTQCRELLERGAPGIHFYTLNKSHATREIFMNLKNEGAVL